MKKAVIVKNELQKWLKNASKIVVVGIGNYMRRDDYVGVEVTKGLRNHVSSRVMVIESETVPESFFEQIEEFNPSHVMIIDAGLIGLRPGEFKFYESISVLGSSNSTISTHALPLKIFCEYLETIVGVSVGLIIVQPERTDLGDSLSDTIGKVAKSLRGVLLEVLP